MNTTDSKRLPYTRVAAALLALLIATILSDGVDLGGLAWAVALGIASAKALLIATYFMHLRHASPASRLFAGAGLFWLAILGGLTLADVLGRS